MAKIFLSGEVKQHWSPETAFDHVQRVKGQIAKAKDNRRVIRFEFREKAYFLKHHIGVGWKEIFKNLLQLKLPVLGAGNEWYAIEKLQALHIPSLEAVAFGERGFNPANRESFLITRELKHTITLEKLCAGWKETPPSYHLKIALVEKVASIARKMHANGLNHRDFYLCHILLDISGGLENLDPNNVKLYLVDLHRMQIRDQVPTRWLVKDVGSIYFSALDIGLTKRDVMRFVRSYSGLPARQALKTEFWQKVKTRSIKLYRRDFGAEARLIL